MKKITSRLYQIGMGSVNAFLIEDDGLTLIDTGHPEKLGLIFSQIENAGENPQDTGGLFSRHPDHSGSAAAIKKALNIPVFAHPYDALLMERGESGRKPMHLTPGFMAVPSFATQARRCAKNSDNFAFRCFP